MQKLRFSKDRGQAFHQLFRQRAGAILARAGRNRYANGAMKRKIAFYLLAIAISYSLVLVSANKTVFFTAYLFCSLLVLLSVFNISHDAAHDALFPNKKWNRILYQLSFTLLGNNAWVWKKYHIESHHLYTNVHGSDIDVLENPLLRMTEQQPWKPWHRFQWLYAPVLYLFYSLNWCLVRELLLLFGYSSRTIQVQLPRRELLILVCSKLFYFGYTIALPAIISPFGWQFAVTAFLLSHFLISLVIVAVLSVSHLSEFADHPVAQDGQVEESWACLQMRTSVDYHAESRALNFILGGFNAHALHHLLPNTCHIHYPLLVNALRQTAAEFGIPYNEMSYGRALKAHFTFLKQMGYAPQSGQTQISCPAGN